MNTAFQNTAKDLTGVLDPHPHSFPTDGTTEEEPGSKPCVSPSHVLRNLLSLLKFADPRKYRPQNWTGQGLLPAHQKSTGIRAYRLRAFPKDVSRGELLRQRPGTGQDGRANAEPNLLQFVFCGRGRVRSRISVYAGLGGNTTCNVTSHTAKRAPRNICVAEFSNGNEALSWHSSLAPLIPKHWEQRALW